MLPSEAFDLTSYRWNTWWKKKPEGASDSFQAKNFDGQENWLIFVYLNGLKHLTGKYNQRLKWLACLSNSLRNNSL